ncbi:dihydrosphingosine 1-phosphate phosphatase [Acrodontium crateriforme]|uniref:Dihydrosphingosine 1-phosphate phosphatase n=1 Tax=Acrodontium crateriforme TaxID=150365 RepID=A0AAQ3MB91_9PEZI|nr:dihydrosphingosine 1-phosphate phosphatase [Acrodontium crateriforme]
MPTAAPAERYAAHLNRTPSPKTDPDAGLRGLGHYERRLPAWRFRLRQRLIPIVRWETPYLARMQELCRTPLLDSYFAISANLGTHTFFMTALPICFWCGYPEMGIALVQMLALGVYLSGYVKDLVCLPRPLSPPLHRITMSGSAALEYGFPSTHTTNAVSVAIYCIYRLSLLQRDPSDLTYRALTIGCYVYAASITFGRMYCGMHGFFDVIFGGILGALIAWVRIAYGPAFDQWVIEGNWTNAAIVVLVLGIAVRIHPEPADNCPCFDDSVAFSGVVMGVAIGTWHYYCLRFPQSLANIYTFENHNLLYPVARVVLGILAIFVWRATMKPLLLQTLPPIFRSVDTWGFRLPRRYFLQSRDYKSVPTLRKDDNVIPPASEIPAMVSNLRHPRRRAISVGPQSEADAREFIANREQRRRNSRSASAKPALDDASVKALSTGDSAAQITQYPEVANTTSYLDAGEGRRRQAQSHLQVGGTDINLLTPPLSDAGASSDSGREDEKNDREMFSSLQKPRIRYDVEVITKLVVYAGIAWLAVEGNPLLFSRMGLT